ncbi:hypothetical protein MRB53_002628 [Persea americana]|uniref:Uncharacterized protein n=1 Tax=Persea americana TaxID=3435 RepID=A0ACC2MVA8_PERAE|nr:hypothetical protein MRB53_002628 [Persea americana]
MNGLHSADIADSSQRPVSEGERVYFVPYRWLREAQNASVSDAERDKGILYTASSSSSFGGPMKIINNIFNSDLVFNLRREVDSEQPESSDEGISGRDYALILDDTWLQALKW